MLLPILSYSEKYPQESPADIAIKININRLGIDTNTIISRPSRQTSRHQRNNSRVFPSAFRREVQSLGWPQHERMKTIFPVSRSSQLKKRLSIAAFWKKNSSPIFLFRLPYSLGSFDFALGQLLFMIPRPCKFLIYSVIFLE